MKLSHRIAGIIVILVIFYILIYYPDRYVKAGAIIVSIFFGLLEYKFIQKKSLIKDTKEQFVANVEAWKKHKILLFAILFVLLAVFIFFALVGG